ncbi:hypothetical protein IZ6_14680 [Terrihabitans soli]|uniref:DUF1993 domain-containing protein n=1 Tax=Terrihabitans soli TaxID=708113 RepID=A0A6S6QHR4_9HYPH|nr:DUF1993 domain-containing protein [Terrihabitans soli]BCJ90733.1 hypothetical protein IZ6_14680 [Terrihabitans soli]
MPIAIYDASVPAFIRALENLDAILVKGEEFAKEKGIDGTELVETRLVEDMDPLRSQIQRASDAAKGAGARLTGTEIPGFPDDEKTLPELRQRIAKTVSYLKDLDPKAFEGAEGRTVTLNTRRTSYELSGQDYFQKFALPNFYFHVTTAYAILRHKGVQIGKMDYLGDVGGSKKGA